MAQENNAIEEACGGPQQAAEAVSDIQRIINEHTDNRPSHEYQLYEIKGRPGEDDGLLLLVIGHPGVKIASGLSRVCSGLLYVPEGDVGSTVEERFSHVNGCALNLLPKLTRRTICVDRMYRELPEGVALYVGAKRVTKEGPLNAVVQIRVDPAPTTPTKKGVVSVRTQCWAEDSTASFSANSEFVPPARVALEE